MRGEGWDMKLTKKKTIALHRELWDWLYRHPSEPKWKWPRWGNFLEILNDCFPCEYTGQKCSECPLQWPKAKDTFIPCGHGSIYYEWANSNNSRTRKKYAKMLRDLPERSGT